MLNRNALTNLETKVLEIVKLRFKNNEITGKELSLSVGILERRGKVGAGMRAIINSLRDKGRVVCANGNGYYYPRTVEELADYIDQFQSRIDEQQRACDMMKERARVWFEYNSEKESKETELQKSLF